MKRRFLKIIIFLFAIVTCVSVASCSKELAIDGEDMDWQLVLISSDKTGDVIYCAAEYKVAYPKAETLDLSCRASDGRLIITDNKTEIGYVGTYQIDKEGKESSYTVTMGGENGKVDGYAEVSEATLHDDSLEYNLIIVIDGYTLNFKSEAPDKE
jgi:hypothetical protein